MAVQIQLLHQQVVALGVEFVRTDLMQLLKRVTFTIYPMLRNVLIRTADAKYLMDLEIKIYFATAIASKFIDTIAREVINAG